MDSSDRRSARDPSAPLTPGSVESLRAVLNRTNDRDALAAPVERLLELAGEIPPGAELTIDYTFHGDLGHPLVVLRIPADTAPAAASTGEHARLASKLSPREREIAFLVAAGCSNQHIADRLFITLGTVKDHVHRILRKTGLPNRVALGVAWSSDHETNLDDNL